MIKKVFISLLLFASAFSYAQEFAQNKEQTKVTFKIKNFGVNVNGDFKEVSIQTNFDSTNLSKSYINAIIMVKSLDTGIKGRDKHILKEDYFDESNYKKIVLKSTKIENNNNGEYLLFADLTIKKTTKKIELPISITTANEELLLNAKFQINRKDFDIGGGSFIMSKKVKIQVQYIGVKQS